MKAFLRVALFTLGAVCSIVAVVLTFDLIFDTTYADADMRLMALMWGAIACADMFFRMRGDGK
jgi:hypothetical protein